MGCTGTQHGTANARRKHGCTCEAAIVAYRKQQKRTRVRMALEGPLRTDATGTRRRIRALQRAGWPLREIARRIGWTSVGGMHNLLSRGTEVHVDTARKVAALYSELECEDGPDVRARLYAERKGWAAPWDWHGLDMDDPDVSPDVRVRRNGRTGAPTGRPAFWDDLRVHDVAFLRSLGVGDHEIARRMGLGDADALRQALGRYQRRMERPATLAG